MASIARGGGDGESLLEADSIAGIHAAFQCGQVGHFKGLCQIAEVGAVQDLRGLRSGKVILQQLPHLGELECSEFESASAGRASAQFESNSQLGHDLAISHRPTGRDVLTPRASGRVAREEQERPGHHCCDSAEANPRAHR